MSIDCEICTRESDDTDPVGGWVFRNARWSVCAAPRTEVPGWFFLELRRHAEGPMELTQEEALELGPIIRRLSGAVQRAVRAKRVYLLWFGDNFPHFHMLVAARPPGMGGEEPGLALIPRAGEFADRQAAARATEKVRRALAITE
jgi:diadenosine tetraphosphate (Ap4A) HIT family hydrolase